jgi:hypothetical protein
MRLACLAVCSVRPGRTHDGSPGVNTMLSVRRRRVYAPGPIMDRGLNPVLRTRPSQIRLTRLLYVAPYFRVIPPRRDRLLQRHCCQYPVAITLCPSPPSGWARDLLLTELPVPKAHPLDIVPYPAHNNKVNQTARTSAALTR